MERQRRRPPFSRPAMSRIHGHTPRFSTCRRYHYHHWEPCRWKIHCRCCSRYSRCRWSSSSYRSSWNLCENRTARRARVRKEQWGGIRVRSARQCFVTHSGKRIPGPSWCLPACCSCCPGCSFRSAWSKILAWLVDTAGVKKRLSQRIMGRILLASIPMLQTYGGIRSFSTG
jgi:hypothetical protein